MVTCVCTAQRQCLRCGIRLTEVNPTGRILPIFGKNRSQVVDNQVWSIKHGPLALIVD